MTNVTANGNGYSDDGSAARDMRGGGHRTWLLPMIADTMVEVGRATTAATAAGTALANTITARDAAAGSAGAAAADRVQTGADKASVATALATAQALVGSAGTGTATGLVYGALTKSLAAAADVVAVYLYDTRLDSDGGAWTGRAGGSWYWETLGTSTRGATRRFPTVALLVLRAVGSLGNILTIYDAHDLDASGVPRLWMAFPGSAGYWAQATTAKAVFALNGRVWVCTSDGAAGGRFHEVNFIADQLYRRSASALGIIQGGTIASRATAPSTASLVSSGAIAANDCNAVHARVLPGAPLDSAGLPIPTVAVATAGGMSVIHPWGAVYDITGAAFKAVALTSSGRLMAMYDASPQVDVGPVPYADIVRTSWRQYAYSPTNFPVLAPATAAATALTSQAIGYSDRLTLLWEDIGSPTNGMVYYVALNYATGWQPGDIRGAWLCDTTTGSITGSGELVANGDFSAGTTGWTGANSAGLSVVSGQLRVTNAAANGTAYTAISTVTGQTYLLSVDVGAISGGTAFIGVGTVAAVNNVVAAAAVTTGLGRQMQFTATATTSYINLGNINSSTTTDFDNVSVRLALPDRSYRGRGLVPYGTLQRTALPCGLAAVSGFSASNYIEQPYNPDLDFGSGDFCLMAWVLLGPGEAGGCVFSRTDDSDPSVLLSVTSSLLFRTRLNGANEFNVSSATDIRGLGWRRITAVRRGTTQELWLDDLLMAQASVTAVSLSESTAKARWGQRVDASQPYSGGSICMARVAAYAPTPAQIRRTYDDERSLIIGGMAATLGGTSSNVTALSANDAIGTLAVGTGDGVSVFAGLARVQYLDGASGGVAIANDAIVSVSASGPHMMIGTSANAGLISDAVNARDRLSPAGPVRPGIAADPSVVTARGVTTHATPTDLSPRIFIGEREAVTLDVTVQARTYGAASTQGGTYRRLARYIRDAGGNVTLAGSVQTIGTDQETTAGMDVTLSIDTAAQTVTPRVTGVAATRLVWTARIVITRISEEASYAA